MLTLENLTKKVEYHIARNGNDFVWVGFVQLYDGEELIFHEALTTKEFDSSIPAEQVQSEANAEADAILARDSVKKFFDDYVFLKNNDLYK